MIWTCFLLRKHIHPEFPPLTQVQTVPLFPLQINTCWPPCHEQLVVHTPYKIYLFLWVPIYVLSLLLYPQCFLASSMLWALEL